MKYKLVSLNNMLSAGNVSVGKTGKFTFDGKRFTFDVIMSSSVSFIEVKDGKMTVKTRNSVYVFEQVVE